MGLMTTLRLGECVHTPGPTCAQHACDTWKSAGVHSSCQRCSFINQMAFWKEA
jgi:hypothetical protein